MNPEILVAKPLANHELEVHFSNGECRLFDLKPYLDRGVFVRLREPALFAAVQVVAGCLEWPGGLDLSNDTIYLRSRVLAGLELSTI